MYISIICLEVRKESEKLPLSSTNRCYGCRCIFGLALVTILFLILTVLPLCLVIRSRYDKTVETRLTSPVAYSTLLFSLDGLFMTDVTLKVNSPRETRKSVSLYVFSSPPPLDVHENLTLFIPSNFINRSSQFSCYQFYLQPGSSMNWTFHAAVQVQYSVVRGNGLVDDYNNVKPPLTVVFQGSSGSTNAFVQYSYYSTKFDLYHFCVAAKGTVVVRNLSFFAKSLQYNLNAKEFIKCVPSDEHSSCTLDVPGDSRSGSAIVEVTSTDPDSPDVMFTLDISPSFIVPTAFPLAVATALLTAGGLVLVIRGRRISKDNRTRGQDDNKYQMEYSNQDKGSDFTVTGWLANVELYIHMHADISTHPNADTYAPTHQSIHTLTYPPIHPSMHFSTYCSTAVRIRT